MTVTTEIIKWYKSYTSADKSGMLQHFEEELMLLMAATVDESRRVY